MRSYKKWKHQYKKILIPYRFHGFSSEPHFSIIQNISILFYYFLECLMERILCFRSTGEPSISTAFSLTHLSMNHPDVRLRQRMSENIIPIKSGHKYSLYHCSESAMTRHMEIIVTSVLEMPVFKPDYVGSCRGSYRIGTFKRFRKKGEFHLDVKLHRTLVVPGWNQLQVDHEAFGNFQCSATINIAGSPEQVRELVDRNINPHFTAHDTILAFPHPWNEMENDEGIPVYPESPTRHAVIERIRNSNSSGQ
ncbi:MAG: hypothetical protein QM680_10035 [Luteolibacter sp.]